jgi:hypothetical protein
MYGKIFFNFFHLVTHGKCVAAFLRLKLPLLTHMPPKILGVIQKTLSYMPNDRYMAMFSIFIYYIDSSLLFFFGW